jgi:hypothetical protein
MRRKTKYFYKPAVSNPPEIMSCLQNTFLEIE